MGATRLWARARVKWLALPERSSRRSGLTWRPAGGHLRVAEIRTPPNRPSRRSEEWPASACQLYDGSDRPDSDSLQRRRSRGKSSDSASTPSAPQEAEPGAAPRCLQSLLIRGGGVSNVHMSLITGGGHSPTPGCRGGQGVSPPRAGEGACCCRQGGGPKQSSSRVGGLKARSPRAGLVGPPGEEGPSAIQDVSSLTLDLLSLVFRLDLFIDAAFCLLEGTPILACSALRP
jgi:hypothetical protein